MKTVLSAALAVAARPHKSTTHEELFFHINNRGTVFFRKEEGEWRASYALRDPRDQFCRKTGRTIARRKFFQGKVVGSAGSARPSYEQAEDVISFAEIRRTVKF